MNDDIEIGAIVKISGLWLSQQNKWRRERWTAKEGVVMRMTGAFADVRNGEINEEISVPVSELRLVTKWGKL